MTASVLPTATSSRTSFPTSTSSPTPSSTTSSTASSHDPSSTPSPTPTATPSAPTGPSFSSALSALKPMPAHNVPWYRRERWLVTLLAAFVPMALAWVGPATLHDPLLGLSGALIAMGLIQLAAHELRAHRRVSRTSPAASVSRAPAD